MPDSTPVPSHLIEQAAEIIRRGWLAEIARLDVRGDSPPEDVYVFALRTMLLGEFLEGRIHLGRNVPLVDPTSGAVYEIDVLLTQPMRMATFAIDCRSRAHHGGALTPAEHDSDTERTQTLVRVYRRVLPFTGLQMLRPWQAALRTIHCIATFPEFAPLRIPPTVLSLAQEYAQGPTLLWSAQADGAGTERGPARRLPAQDRLHRDLPHEIIAEALRILGLPPEGADNDRWRAEVQWTDAELALLREARHWTKDTEVLGALLGRSGRAVVHKLASLGLFP